MLNWIPNVTRGAASYRRGYKLIFQPGIRQFVVLPLAINTLTFAALFSWLRHQMQSLLSWMDESSVLQWLAGVESLAWLITLIHGLMWLLFGVGVIIAVFYVFTLVANVLAAPFNGLLAERVEHHLLGRTTAPASTWQSVLRALPRTVISELRKFIYLALWIVPLLALTLTPGLNFFATVAWLWFGAWLSALEYVDYPMGNNDHSFSEVRARMRQHRASAMGFGACAAVMQSIPIVNLIAMPAAVAGATALWVDHLQPSDSTETTLEQ